MTVVVMETAVAAAIDSVAGNGRRHWARKTVGMVAGAVIEGMVMVMMVEHAVVAIGRAVGIAVAAAAHIAHVWRR